MIIFKYFLLYIYIRACIILAEETKPVDVDIKKIVPDVNEQKEMLEKMVKAIFGYGTKLDFNRYNFESKIIKIIDIYWSEDLLTILQRLREDFYVNFDSEICECEDCKKLEYNHRRDYLTIELILRE